jgi:hypothetical protein
MKKITEKHNWLGSVEFFENLSGRDNYFLAKPHGLINPSLLREDVNQARAFSKRSETDWDYITNTEDVRIVNPFNLFYLKEVKKIKRLKRIVIFAPNPINYILIQAVSKMVKPDMVFQKKKDFLKFLGEKFN